MSEPIIIEDLEKYKESGYLTVRRLKKILDGITITHNQLIQNFDYTTISRSKKLNKVAFSTATAGMLFSF
jgi:hypothetical protein